MEVKLLLKKKVIAIGASATLHDVVKIMADNNVGLLPIVDEGGRPLAVISEKDVVKAAAAGVSLEEPAMKYAAKGNLLTVGPETNVYEALEKMRRARLRHILVVDKEGRLLGVLSIRDFMRDDVLSYLGFQAWQPPDYGQPEFMSL